MELVVGKRTARKSKMVAATTISGGVANRSACPKDVALTHREQSLCSLRPPSPVTAASSQHSLHSTSTEASSDPPSQRRRRGDARQRKAEICREEPLGTNLPSDETRLGKDKKKEKREEEQRQGERQLAIEACGVGGAPTAEPHRAKRREQKGEKRGKKARDTAAKRKEREAFASCSLEAKEVSVSTHSQAILAVSEGGSSRGGLIASDVSAGSRAPLLPSVSFVSRRSCEAAKVSLAARNECVQPCNKAETNGDSPFRVAGDTPFLRLLALLQKPASSNGVGRAASQASPGVCTAQTASDADRGVAREAGGTMSQTQVPLHARKLCERDDMTTEERHREQGRSLLALLKRQGDRISYARDQSSSLSSCSSDSQSSSLSSVLSPSSSFPSSSPSFLCSVSSSAQSPAEASTTRKETSQGRRGRRTGKKVNQDGGEPTCQKVYSDGSSTKPVSKRNGGRFPVSPINSTASAATPLSFCSSSASSVFFSSCRPKGRTEDGELPFQFSSEKSDKALSPLPPQTSTKLSPHEVRQDTLAASSLSVSSSSRFSPLAPSSSSSSFSSSFSSSAFALSPLGLKGTFALPAFMRSPDPSKVRMPCAFLSRAGRQSERGSRERVGASGDGPEEPVSQRMAFALA
ncbi:hypothetical protein TGCAST_244190 [Toxoplasma gondii CAST]|uniref:Uncharacterized protein n=1 Tax=Toxoplasma gondii CAST TaxID=943122 RepID=A0A3R7YMR7_TOXGO|nr:hypothetical protein TGCAST_244190 [Toxoplasma gondii CAST]